MYEVHNNNNNNKSNDNVYGASSARYSTTREKINPIKGTDFNSADNLAGAGCFLDPRVYCVGCGDINF